MNQGVHPAPAITWLTDWDAALAEARAIRKVVLIDVIKDP
jgi:hypothetical protein